MLTFLVVCFIGFLWHSSNSKYSETHEWKWRRKRAAYAWSLIGALVGSYFGVAGMGSAIAGTIPAAVFTYLLASNLMKSDFDPRQHISSSIAQVRDHSEEHPYSHHSTTNGSNYDEPTSAIEEHADQTDSSLYTEPVRVEHDFPIVSCPHCGARRKISTSHFHRQKVTCFACTKEFSVGP